MPFGCKFIISPKGCFWEGSYSYVTYLVSIMEASGDNRLSAEF